MYQFVFQNPKNRLSTYDYRRKNLGSTHGQFELKELRKNTRNEVIITGYGNHEIHRCLSNLKIDNFFNGHVLEVSEPSAAIWIKLNYDQLGKGKLTYQGGYQDIDIEVLKEISQRYREIESKNTSNYNQSYSINTTIGWLKRLKEEARKANPTNQLLTDDELRDIEDLKVKMENAYRRYSSEQAKNSNDLALIRKEATDYLSSCGMDPVARNR